MEIKRTLKEKIFAIINEYYDSRLGSKLSSSFKTRRSSENRHGNPEKRFKGQNKLPREDFSNKKKRIFNVSSNRIEFLRYLRIVNVYQKFEYDDLRKNMTRYMSII